MSSDDADSVSSADSEDYIADEIDVTGGTIEIVVGKEKAIYFAHETLLKEKSKFFRTALKTEWEEGQKRSITLPDEDPDSVYAYFQWLYTKKLFITTTDKQGSPVFDALARLYVLGERLLDDELQDNVLSKLFAPSRADKPIWPGNAAINIIYEGTPSMSPARRLLVDNWVRDGHKDWVDRSKNGRWKLHDEFKTDVVQALLKHRPLLEEGQEVFSGLGKGKLCAYYKHGCDDPCNVKNSVMEQ